ncbi:unnamed protein product [Adineta steineri]|uniref:Uncharacterized protein n=1 Tax=Adineta steineri TaxID=433720 RepID=A0A815UUB9_9BILA|nr:unnamed protein product [Adineta steineri]CAF1374037.1 unnamed protein product [Adineta steineri]CAF1521882.1 unnamed protein product [Adineta steineri]CAF1604992.1 unnamed protein product [Adineta steineri]
MPKPFPVITPQSYLPGSPGASGAFYPGGANQPSGIPPTMYPPLPPNQSQPPILNPNYGSGYPPQYNGPMPYPNRNPMPPRPPFQKTRFASLPRRRPPEHAHHRYRSRRCRPVIHIIDSDSCSSISTCSSESSYERYHCRSHSYPRRCGTRPQQQQQPIIFLPVQCQQQPSAMKGSFQGQIQPMILPSSQVQQPFLALQSASTIQPSLSMPQMVPARRPQQIQAGPITYVYAGAPQTSSSSTQLKNPSGQSYSNIGSQRNLVNNENTKESVIIKPIPRTSSLKDPSTNTLKYERIPCDHRYITIGKERNCNDENQGGQRRETKIT